MNRKLYYDNSERRDKLQLLADIIKVSSQETKITRVLRLANIQYNTFHESLETLCSCGLLEKVKLNQKSRSSQDKRTKYTYRATEIGMKWCEMVDWVYNALEESV